MILDIKNDFGVDADGLFNKDSQDIDHDFLGSLRAEREDSVRSKIGEHMRVASVPVIIVERWLREGFSIYDKNVTPQAILRRLRTEGLDQFITTNRKV